MTPRPHAEIIKLWADGHDVQYRRPDSNEWVDSPDPAFVSDYEYRVKPARVYPSFDRFPDDLGKEWRAMVQNPVGGGPLLDFLNAILRHAIDNGQVVTREEFAKVSEEAQCATKTLIAAGYTYRGGELWKPPLGRTVAGTQRLIDCLRVIRAKAKASGTVVMNMECDFGMVSLEEFVDRALKAAGMT